MVKITNQETPHNVRLTSPEIANLWSQFQNDSMAVCVYKYMLKIVEDVSIQAILEHALSLAEKHISIIKDYFTAEKFPIPHGFTDDDIDLSAPRLFSDIFFLTYTYIMSVNGLVGYASAISSNMRRDIRDYFVKCQNESMELFNNSLDLLLEKGAVSRPPFINPAEKFEFIDTHSYIGSVFGEKRTLNCIELSNLYWDLRKIQLSKSLTMGFSQVAKSQDVKQYLWRGVKLYSKQISELESVLNKEHIPKPKSEEAEVTNSTISPFSDRLLMFHKALLGSTSIGVYGTALGTCHRIDLGIKFGLLMTEMATYMKDGLEILIKYKWAEQPPLSDDREKLSTQE